MSSQPAPSSQAPDGPPSLSQDEDFARPLLEAQLAGLQELADLGREMARCLVKIAARQSEAAEPNPAFDAPACSLALDRAARGVRMSYALEQTVIDLLRGVGRIEADRTDEARRAAEAEAQARLAQARARAEAPERAHAHARKLQIGKAVNGIIADAHDDDTEGFERHVREAQERLRDHEVLDNVLGRPASEVIADICRLLGLEPNWEGLAFEAWALEERQSDKVGAPLRSPPPWTGRRPGIRGRLLKAEAESPLPPVPEDLPLQVETDEAPEPPSAEVAQAPPPYVPPPDPDILPGYPCGLPGEFPPERPRRKPYWA